MFSKNVHPAAMPVDDLLAECEVRRQRRSGPGGQHRNKVETAVVIRHRLTGVKGEASERRSQQENRSAALFRLRVNLALEQRTAVVPSVIPSQRWQLRCRNGRIIINPAHEDFPALLAEALDVLHVQNTDVKSAARQLGCTTSQLTRFLKLESRAFQQVNARRRFFGLPPLR